MSTGNEEQESGKEQDTTTHMSRRAAMLLAGVAGGGLLTGGSAGTASASKSSVSDGSLHIDGSNAMQANLDMGDGTNSINDIDNVRAGSNYASFTSSGTGNGHLQFYDREAGSHMFRAFEGQPDKPGRIEFQSPIMGADEDDVGTAPEGTRNLVIEEGANVEYLSVPTRNQVNVVSDLGVEPGSGTDVAAEIDSYLSNQTTINELFIFPEGEYTWNTELQYSEFEFLGFVGAPRARLRVTDKDMNLLLLLGSGSDSYVAERAVLKNLTVDINDLSDGTVIDAGTIQARMDDFVLVENVDVSGSRQKWQDRDGDGSYEHNTEERFSFQVQMTQETGVAIMRNVRQPDGGTYISEKDTVGHVIPFSSDPHHYGTKIYEGCWVEGFIDNGFYIKNSPGHNLIHNCVAKNNGGGNIRLGAGDVCRDSKIILDNGSANGEWHGSGLWLNGGEPLAENVTIEAPDAANDLLRINSSSDGGTVRNIRINNGDSNNTGAPNPAVRLTESSDTDHKPVTIENVTIRDYADSGTSVAVERPRVTIRDLDLESHGSARDYGIKVEDSDVNVSGRIRGEYLERVVLIEGHIRWDDDAPKDADDVNVDLDIKGWSDASAAIRINGDYDNEGWVVKNVDITGTMEGNGHAVEILYPEVSDVTVRDVSCKVDNAPALTSHWWSDATNVHDIRFLGCDVTGGSAEDIDVGASIDGVWIKNNVAGSISGGGHANEFIRDNKL